MGPIKCVGNLGWERAGGLAGSCLLAWPWLSPGERRGPRRGAWRVGLAHTTCLSLGLGGSLQQHNAQGALRVGACPFPPKAPLLTPCPVASTISFSAYCPWVEVPRLHQACGQGLALPLLPVWLWRCTNPLWALLPVCGVGLSGSCFLLHLESLSSHLCTPLSTSVPRLCVPLSVLICPLNVPRPACLYDFPLSLSSTCLFPFLSAFSLCLCFFLPFSFLQIPSENDRNHWGGGMVLRQDPKRGGAWDRSGHTLGHPLPPLRPPGGEQVFSAFSEAGHLPGSPAPAAVT